MPARRNQPSPSGFPSVAASLQVACVILAAGKGTRMSSAHGKVLHELFGVPLCSYPVQRAQELEASPIVAVLGHQRQEVERALVRRHGKGAITVVEQSEQRGTGHAVRLALTPLEGFLGTVLILYGDVPMLRRETLGALVAQARRTGGLAFLSMEVPDPTGYGRVVRDGKGRVLKIVEEKDARPAQRKIRECNGGIYAGPAEFLRQATAKLEPKNAQGEYYLTDVVEQAAGSIGVSAIVAEAGELAGINDRFQLAEAEAAMSRRSVERFAATVTFRDAGSVRVGPDVTIEQDADIGRNVSLRGSTRIGRDARIDDGAVLTDTIVEEGATVGAGCVASGALVRAGTAIEPLTRIAAKTDSERRRPLHASTGRRGVI